MYISEMAQVALEARQKVIARPSSQKTTFVLFTQPLGLPVVIQGHPNREHVIILGHLVARSTVDSVT